MLVNSAQRTGWPTMGVIAHTPRRSDSMPPPTSMSSIRAGLGEAEGGGNSGQVDTHSSASTAFSPHDHGDHFPEEETRRDK